MTLYWCQRAWLGGGAVAERVLLRVDADRFSEVEAGVPAPPKGARRLSGLAIPGFANCHSHAFHRALRGRTQAADPGGRGSFWSWREQMYAVAARLDPDSCHALARATYAEMALAGITCVGEFHYLHHGERGMPYDDPNAMGEALVAAAQDAGIRIALLDACYLTGGIGAPLAGVQQRFGDDDAVRWSERVEDLLERYVDTPDVVVGAALHSVRAVPREQLGTVAQWAAGRDVPLHVHLSEQVAENDACLAAYGATPTAVLGAAGVLGPGTSAVHATHLGDDDVELLGSTGTRVCLCPTTERDLGDGSGPSSALRAAGSALTMGSDSHAVIDPLEEMRGVELHERLATQRRGHFRAEELMLAATREGHASLGFPDAGVIAPGAIADLVTIDDTSARTAGAGGGLELAVFAATAADVTPVLIGGRPVQSADVGADLGRVVGRLWEGG